ncbi:hypothetical protein FACS1894170_03180 [Planctomycetales bacterium]|nr:hypothetical protein FACS1894170_03180 [Planctomycetales bacterium]
MPVLLRLAGIIVLALLLPYQASAQVPAPIQYGSIGSTDFSVAAKPADIVAPVLDFSPIYVAQNTAPAAISTTPPPVAPPLTAQQTLPAFDPYQTSASSWFSSFGQTASPASSSALGQPSSLGQSSSSLGSFDKYTSNTVQSIRRFREATSFDFSYLPGGNKVNSFGLGQADVQMRLAFPCRFIPNNTGASSGTGWFYVVPGASFFWFDGPVGPPDMSANAFGTYLKFGTEPQFNNVFGLRAWGQLGIFSDYHKITSDAFRFSGDLEGTVQISPQMQIVAGVLYLGRERIRVLPTGGLIYRPSEDWTLRLVFPNPKITKHLWKGQYADVSGYIDADYCGNTWDIKYIGATDYNDIRVGTGLEFVTPRKIAGYFEFGGSFARELYSNGQRWCKAPEVLYLKTGFVF